MIQNDDLGKLINKSEYWRGLPLAGACGRKDWYTLSGSMFGGATCVNPK